MDNTNFFLFKTEPYCKTHYSEAQNYEKIKDFGNGAIRRLSSLFKITKKEDVKKKEEEKIEVEEFLIIKVDTLLERLHRESKMSLEELQKEQEEISNHKLIKIHIEKCCFCDIPGDVAINCCDHKYCQECFEMTQSNYKCLIEGCEKIYKEATNLKNGMKLKFEENVM